jgi:hypothetical protein
MLDFFAPQQRSGETGFGLTKVDKSWLKPAIGLAVVNHNKDACGGQKVAFFAVPGESCYCRTSRILKANNHDSGYSIHSQFNRGAGPCGFDSRVYANGCLSSISW